MNKILRAEFMLSASSYHNAPAPSASEVVFLGRSNVGKSTLINSLLGKALAKSSATPGKTRLINFFRAEFLFCNDLDSEISESSEVLGFGKDSESKKVSESNSVSESSAALESKKAQESKIFSKSCELDSEFCKKEPHMETKIPLIFVDLPGFGYAKVSKSIKKSWEQNLMEFLLRRDAIKLFIQLLDARHINLDIDNEVSALLAQICKNDQKIIRIYTKADKLSQSELQKLLNKISSQDSESSPSQFVFSATKQSRKILGAKELRDEVIKGALGLG